MAKGKGDDALLLLAGPPKGKGDMEMEMDDEDMGTGDAGAVYDALKNDDREGFIMALEDLLMSME